MAKNINSHCSAYIWQNAGAWGSVHCSRKGTICREGKWYCKQHDPVAVKNRAIASTAKYDAEWKQKREQWDRRDAEHDACKGVPTDQLKPGLMAQLLEAVDGNIQG